jgi:hypothetical protein
VKPGNRSRRDIDRKWHTGAASTADTCFAVCRRQVTLDGGEGAATWRRSSSLFLHIFLVYSFPTVLTDTASLSGSALCPALYSLTYKVGHR